MEQGSRRACAVAGLQAWKVRSWSRSLDSLRGCLASTVPFPGLEAEKAAARSVGYSKVLRFCANVQGRQLSLNRLDGPPK